MQRNPSNLGWTKQGNTILFFFEGGVVVLAVVGSNVCASIGKYFLACWCGGGWSDADADADAAVEASY